MAKVVKIGPKDIPGLELAKGMMTQYNVCQETVGSEFIKMGVCNQRQHQTGVGERERGQG